jgi:hypothetical protein
MKRRRTARAKRKQKPNAIVAVVSQAGAAKNTNVLWHLAAEGDMVDVGEGDLGLVVAAEAARLLATEISKIPMGTSRRDQHVRQWMLEIAAHKASIRLKTRCGRLPSVSMHYLIETTSKWGATIFETTRQLLKRDMLPIRSETPPECDELLHAVLNG